MENKRNQLLLDVITSDINNYVDWTYISRCPESNLSEDFIREFKDKVNWYNIFRHKNVSHDLIKDFKHMVNFKMYVE